MEKLLERIVAWGKGEERVRAMLLTGSYARPDGADAFSDLDIALFGDLDSLAGDGSWLAEIAPVWVCLRLQTDEGHPTRLVIFAGSRKVDFSLLPIKNLQGLIDAAEPLPELYDRGYRVLLDKDGLAAQIPPQYRHHAREAPSVDAFLATVEEFWFEVWHVAKYLVRGDGWHAKFRDWTTKELLLRMIEWHAGALHGWERDTHHLGIGMRAWTEPETWARLHEVFARFDAADSWLALDATAGLFGDLARDVAARLMYAYPAALEQQVLDTTTAWRPDDHPAN